MMPRRRFALLRSSLGRWLFRGGSLEAHHAEHTTHPWYLVLWLTGVDYFSTLGYQPGLALLAAGALSPLATVLLVLVTLCGALPIYAQVARRSYAGQGSIAMLEHLLSGWKSKIFVLVLLGFAATDFVITITLSAADATQHAIENPLLHHHLAGLHMPITIGLLALLAVVFLKGLGEAIGVAAAIALPYILLNVISNSSPPILIVTMIPFGCMALWSKGRCPFPDVYRVIAPQVGAFPLFFPCLSSLHL
jgi:hypothetical protein